MFTLFSHVGIAVHDLDQAVELWTETFGLTLVETFEVEVEGVRSAMLSTGGPFGEATCVELIAPLAPDDTGKPIPRRLADHGEGVFHLAFRIDDATTTKEQLDSAGLRSIPLVPAGPAEEPRLIVHPCSANGVLIELLATP
ncbi:MAG: hypothetical protein JWQ81_296 [Amycolatopsis sp.]|uniref:VOC family protein n=1 Tax=Amycolatopsis sp. TaxID=37632 RepID=UPI00260841BB|nr:VOC family protein [Amycolatopsis sp.]MCU1679557.1 hypothetical protein [Amycolatopsis sp.]